MNELDLSGKRSFKIIRIAVSIAFWVGVAVLAVMVAFPFLAPEKKMALDMEGLAILPVPGRETDWATTVLFAVFMLLGLAFLWLMKWILNSMKRGTPFKKENAKYLSMMGVLAFVQSYVGQWNVYRFAQDVYLYHVENGIAPSVLPQFKLVPGSALFAICLLVLAEVFRYGVILQQEHDTTV